MKSTKKNSNDVVEKEIHNIFEEYLIQDTENAKMKEIASRIDKIDLTEETKETDKFCDLMQVYCEEEMEYRLKSMEQAYLAFNKIHELVANELSFKDPIRQDRKGPKR